NAAADEVRGRARENEQLARDRLRDNAQLFYHHVHSRLRLEEGSLGLHHLAQSLSRAREADMPPLEEQVRTQLAAWSRSAPGLQSCSLLLPNRWLSGRHGRSLGPRQGTAGRPGHVVGRTP